MGRGSQSRGLVVEQTLIVAMRKIARSGCQTAMTEQQLNSAHVGAGFQQMYGERMPPRILTLPMNRPQPSIHYRHHPVHGEHVEIVRGLRRYTTDCLVIKLRDDVQVAVPSWMLDPVSCQQLTDEARPRIAVSALSELRELVDSRPWLLTTRQVETSQATPRDRGGDDARAHRAATTATSADI
jgi:hypothetical protein